MPTLKSRKAPSDRSDLLPFNQPSRWDEIQDPIKIATAVSERMTQLALFSSREREKWESLVIDVCKKLLSEEKVREKEEEKAA